MEAAGAFCSRGQHCREPARLHLHWPPRSTDSQNGLGWEAPYRSPLSIPPATGRDPFHQPRLLRAPSSLALSTAREGAATAPLGNLGQSLTTLMGKNFFLISNLNLPSSSFEPFPGAKGTESLHASPVSRS